MALLTAMAAAVVGMAALQSLTAVVLLSGIYSFLMATLMLALDAPDVAMTEAAVGAGVSTVLLLAAVALTGAAEATKKRRRTVSLLVCALTASALIWGTFGLPEFGTAASAPNTHVAPYYLTHSVAETTSPNVVTAVLASYRGYDTLGEVVVIFTAGVAVLMLAGGARSRDERVLQPDIMIRIAAKILIPFILLFALYVQMHGEYGPGGGFQAGATAAAAIILFALIFGLAPAQAAAPPYLAERTMAAGSLIFAGTGLLSLALGGEYLNYSVFGPHAPTAQKWGIVAVEAGVLLAVAGTIVSIYYALAGRRRV